MLSSKAGSEWDGTRYTVFAPTNEAFAKLPSHVVTFLQNNPEALLEVLLLRLFICLAQIRLKE